MKKLAVLVVVFSLCAGALFGQAKKGDDPLKGFNFKKPAGVIAPSPGMVFAALEKVSKGDKGLWKNLANYNTRADYTDRYSQGLNLGVRVANAFVSVQAEDAANLGKMAGAIFTLASKLGVENTVLSYKDTIDRLVRQANPKWNVVRGRIEDMRTGVTQTMEKQDDKAVVTVATVSGWIEGLRIVTKALMNNYTVEGAKLLRQPDLVAYYEKELGKLPEKAKKLESVQKLTSNIGKIKKLISVKKDAAVSKENVVKLNGLATEVVALIEGGK